MAESNYAALGEGLKIYSETMRRLLGERLAAHHKDRWWELGVLSNLTTAQENNLRREMEKDPKRDRLDFIEAAHLPRLIPKEFDRALQGVFPDFNKTRSWLQQAANSRNDWAHPRTGDMLADDVSHALYAMAQVLDAAHLPEATDVEALRREVMGIVATPTAPAAPVVPVAVQAPGPGHLPYWWQVCEPHDGFKNPASVDESLFAASLGGVHAGTARREYLDPEVFFSHTHFTESLKQIIRDVASRMNRGDGAAVTEMQTPFGGGKTHALLTLYHLFSDPQRALAIPGVREALQDLSFPSRVKVLVFDGNEYGTEPIEKQNGATVFTLWGELAFQADPVLFDRLIKPTDSRGERPGNALYRQVLQAASPCLILIDELVGYLVGLKFSSTRRSQNLYRQTVQFLQELLQEAGNVPGVCVLLSLPKIRQEFGGLDPAQLQQELGVVEDLQARADRVVTKRTPVNDDEIYTLMSKRLFKTVDRDAAGRVARMYQEVYGRERALYDPTVFSQDYQQNQINAYPLHPDLVDVLYKKWSTVSDFPRTRAVLQLLANVVADQWVNRREAYAIQSAHVDLEREPIKSRVVSAAGAGGAFDVVVAADIIGGDAHADLQDQQRGGDYQRNRITRGVATTLLMHSFGGTARLGALTAELRLGTVAPNVGPEYVTEVLNALEQSLWYVHREGELLRFQTKINIYRMIAQQAQQQPIATVTERLREVMARAGGTAEAAREGFTVLEWAASDGAIADRPQPTIAVLDPRYAVQQTVQKGDGQDVTVLEGKDAVTRMWDRTGGGLRGFRNALVQVAPDKDLWGTAEDVMKEVLAYEAVLAAADRKTIEISAAEERDLRSRLKDKTESVRTSIMTAYRWVFFPDPDGLAVISLPVPATKDERIATRVVHRLADQDVGQPKILKKMGAVYFESKLAPQLWKDEAAPLELGEMARRFPQWTYLPILPDREGTLRACIREGIGMNRWAVAVGDNTSMTYIKLIETQADLDQVIDIFDGSASLVKGEYRDFVREMLRGEETPPVPGPEPEPPQPPEPPQGPRGGPEPGKPPVIPPPQRFTRVRLEVPDLPIPKTSNLQPYLFRVIQGQDATAQVSIIIDISSSTGIPADVLEQRIVEAFDQLGITVRWEAL